MKEEEEEEEEDLNTSIKMKRNKTRRTNKPETSRRKMQIFKRKTWKKKNIEEAKEKKQLS